jgi:hypothetical protein
MRTAAQQTASVKNPHYTFFLHPSVHLYRALKLLISEESVKKKYLLFRERCVRGSTVGREMEHSA